MLAREPDLFLKSLSDAFFDHTKGQSIPTRNALFFYGANFAAIARLKELDRIIPEFKKLSKQVRTTERMFEEDRLLYGFFTNALSAMESFCFGAYFLGTALSTFDFEPEPELWRIDPTKTLNCFRKLDSNSSFTKALRTCICSERYATTSALRNVLTSTCLASTISPRRSCGIPWDSSPQNWLLKGQPYWGWHAGLINWRRIG